MKIGFISDIHVDLLENRSRVSRALESAVKEKEIDTLVVAGDITENALDTIDMVRHLRVGLQRPVYYVPGNHDLWYKHNRMSTQRIYQMFQDDPHCLVGKEIMLDDQTALVGDVFWYDYTYANQSRFTKDELKLKTYGERTWQDYFFVNWLESDRHQSQRFVQRMAQRLEMLKGKRVILVSHMINHELFTVPESKDEKWGFFNGFLGSRDLQELIRVFQVEVAVCGHVHHRKAFVEDGTKFICSCLGYEGEWPLFDSGDLSVEHHVNQALTVWEG